MDFAFDENGGLVAIAAEGNHIDYCTVNDEKELVVAQTVTIPSGTIYRCNCASNQGVLAITTDSGDVYTYDGEVLNKIYTYDGVHLFNYAVMGSDDVVYASDYNNAEIYALSETGAPELAASEIKTSFMTPGNGNIIFSDEDTQTLQRMDLNTREITGSDSAPFTPLFLMRSAVISLAYLWLIGFIIFWVVRELIRRRRRSKESAGEKVQSPFTRGRAIAFMFISAIIVMSSFIVYYISDHKTQTMSDLAMAATVFADNFKENYVEDLAAINSPADTNGANYQAISDYLNSYWNINLSYNFDSYYFLTRVEDGDTMVVVADGNNQYQPGTRYVTMSDNDEGIALLKGETVQGSGRDSWGDYDYALAPLNDQNGTLVGVIEIGVYSQEFDRSLAQNIFTVILMVLTILMGAIVLMGEMFEIRTALARLADSDKVEHILALYRPFSFFFFLCTAIDYGYQTIILQDLMTANGLAEGSFLHPIILTAMAAGYLIGGPLGTWLSERYPMKRILSVSFIFFVVNSLANSFALYTKSLVLFFPLVLTFNIGYGLIYTVLKIMPTLSADSEKRYGLYRANEVTNATATILGGALGGYVAQFLGYAIMYVIIALFCAVPAAIALFGISDIGVLALEEKHEKKEQKRMSPAKALKFYFSPGGALPIMISMAMILVGMGYKTYYFPLYSQAKGYDLTAIANVTVIVGSLSAVLETNVDKLVGRVGKQQAYVGVLLLMALAMVFAVFNPDYVWAIIFIAISQISMNVCKPYENVFFLERAQACGLPEAEAINLQVIWDNIIRTFLPMIFGLILLGGYSVANLIMAVALFASVLIFRLMVRGRHRSKEERVQ